MNLSVLNRVNLKSECEGSVTRPGMYREWASLSSRLLNGSEEGHSVLEKFPGNAGKDVSLAIIRQLASNVGISQPPQPSNLITDREVQWCMEVICFGLSLPLSEHDTIRDCVNVYCEWLSALLPSPKVSVPKPVVEDPDLYARRIIAHFHNLFVPRKGEGADTINRQAVLCHRVLRTLQHIAQTSAALSRETWEALLLFLLAINDTLLAPPTVKDDVGDQLCERVLSVLLEVWLLACARCFPSPPLWKTLREMCHNWRHRVALVEQWNRVNLALTSRLIQFVYGPSFPELKITEEDAQLVPSDMTPDCISQSWFRFLHTLGNPAQLCRPGVISHTQKFLQYALASDSVIDPCQHPCLSALPIIFLKAIRGVAGQVDAFLGIARSLHMDFGLLSEKERKDGYSSPFSSPSLHSGGAHTSCPSPLSTTPTPLPTRRLAKSFSVTPSTVTKGIPKSTLIGLTSSRASHHTPATPNSGPSSTSSLSSIISLGSEFRNALAPSRPKCNSILHLFGEWLFEAAQIGCETAYVNRVNASSRSESGNTKRPNSVLMDTANTRKGSSSVVSLSQPGSLSLSVSDDSESLSGTAADRYQAGRAEAMGALCRIFCAKKTGEEILPVYLARFYLTLQQGLRVGEGSECSEVLASILLNSADLFRLDLDGVQVLLPYVIDALEEVLPDKELKLKSNTVSRTELRRASIHLLLSVLALPLHFQNLTIKDLNPNTGVGCADRSPLTFAQLKPRLMNLLINALQVESDPQNTQMLLGGLLLSVQDSAAFELSDQVAQPDVVGTSGLANSDCASNLLSSASDTMSSLSLPSLTPSHGEDIVDGAESDRDPGSALSWFERFDQPPTCGINKYSAHALFVRATYLVCHRLISSWKTDLNVSLAALELLSGLARITIKETDSLECKRAVKWLCDYIVYQCWRPPPAHSKDLHSTIVAAFQCCAIWLVAHPYLLQDKECLGIVLEVVELGISGSKSVGKPGEPVKMKDEKELKPASMRVRDSAEALLTVVLEQVGCFPSPCGAESLSSLLDEVSLLRHCNSWPTAGGGPAASSRAAAVQRFRYFVLENSTVLALLEEPLGNDQDPQPTVTVLIRGPFGRHAWAMQLRHLPRHKSGIPHKTAMAGSGMSPGRPVPLAEHGIHQPSAHRHFPESVDRIPQCKIDKSIPSLDSLLTNETTAMEHSRLAQLIDKQSSLEAGGSLGVSNNNNNSQSEQTSNGSFGSSSGLEKECTPPPVVHDFQTARLFLSHFGFLSLDSLQDCVSSPVPPLTALDACNSNFCADLEALDNIGVRTCDTAHVFYVRAGQKTASEIVDNVLSESSVNDHFLEMLLCLGWPVDVHQHPGWTGHINTSWKVQPPPPILEQWVSTDHGGSLYNGDTQVLYWADVSCEIAFVVPSANNLSGSFNGPDSERLDLNLNINSSTSSLTSAAIAQQQQNSRGWYERSVSDCGGVNAIARNLKHPSPGLSGNVSDRHTLNLDKPRAFSLDLDKGVVPQTGPPGSSDSGRRRTGTSRSAPAHHAPTKVLIIWLESFDDNVFVPLGDLLLYTSTGLEGPCPPSDASHPSERDSFVIFLHALPSGLLRVKLQGPQGRMSLATPLVDGMVVSRRALGPLVRQTALNMCRRRRLDNDSYQPPHVRRRLKVQELVSKYRTHMTEPELLTYLFHDPPL
ncbi:hypothetical protein FOCC_FOCC001427 [Frankliniella occidentalis]|uniref:Ral GTPase-activating protein subunit beta isoform X2 n=1 Tax=Frankliniella occidentalis TaxID=133901 RepID=A0A6J1TDK5_FRAOC|nr:ral GTPase-activating protein subunit beta isoform X2 [Frankliniella occidentalis]KAE8751950.1 hypothetical protein FOCC_FOCC001427 [Frankliniella occidentalis]